MRLRGHRSALLDGQRGNLARETGVPLSRPMSTAGSTTGRTKWISLGELRRLICRNDGAQLEGSKVTTGRAEGAALDGPRVTTGRTEGYSWKDRGGTIGRAEGYNWKGRGDTTGRAAGHYREGQGAPLEGPRVLLGGQRGATGRAEGAPLRGP